jgi:uncharacterized protein YjbI with pentapeptide repeats
LKWSAITASVTLVAILVLGNHLSAAEAQKPRPAFLYARAFHSSPAAAGQTVVFESDSADSLVRAELPEGQHRLCLETSGGYFSGVVLDDSTSVPDPQGCITLMGRSGSYQVRLSHRADKPAVREVALLSIDRPGVPLVTANGEMRKGYWAMIPWAAAGRTEATAGRLQAIPSQGGHMPIVADTASSEMDAYSLWRFGANSAVLLVDSKSAFHFDLNAFADSVKGTIFVAPDGEGPSLQANGNSDRFELRLENNDDGSPGAELGFAPTLFAPQTLKVVRSSPHYRKPAIFSLVFRFFPDAADLASLTEREVALYQGADYQRRATVFPASAGSLAALSSSATTLDHDVVSIRLGPGTEATLYTGENYSGAATHIHNNVPLLSGAGNAASIRVTSLVGPLLANRSCVDCNFEGVDLSGLDLAGTDLTGAKLTGANLTNTRLHGARLTNADLSSATLSCTDLSGANANQLNDLTRTTLTNVKILPGNSCQTNFSYTRLLVDALPPSSLAILGLTGVHYERPPQAQAPVPGPPLVDTNGNPVGGYWAIQPDPALDPQKRAGRLRATPPFQPGQNPNDAFVLVDYTSQEMDEYSLFAFPPNSNTNGSILLPGTFFNGSNYGENEKTAIFLTVGQGYTCGQFCTLVNQRLRLTDLGNYRFQLGYYSFWVNSGPFFVWSGGPGPANSFLNGTFSPATTLRVMFRFFPDGTQIGPLADGEAAIFQQPGFKGPAAVFAPNDYPNGYNLDLLEGGATNLPGTVQSVRLGNNTAVTWTTPSRGLWIPPLKHDTDGIINDYSALEHVIYVQKLDQAIVRFAPWIQKGSIGPDPAVFYEAECAGCRLANGNISGVSLQGWNLSGAIFSGATLSNIEFNSATQLAKTKFDNATFSTVQFGNVNLQSVDLSGAALTNSVLSAAKIDKTTNLTGTKMSCVDLSGTDASHLLDLTQVNLSGVQWVLSPSCRTNFSYTKLSVTQIPPSTWKNFNLTGAVFVDLDPHLSSQAQPLDLTGAMLGGMSLQNVFLDYALMKDADLTGALLDSSSLQGVDLEGATLKGTRLVNVNLDGANLMGALLTKPDGTNGNAANLQGAFLRNVNLSQSRLAGADFSKSSFYSTSPSGTEPCTINSQHFTISCATAAGAVMDNTDFSGAYLYGTDFSDTKIQGIFFSNAVLTGANFANASLTTNTPEEKGFERVFLQGANFTGTRFINGISMKDAFVDFGTGGNGAFGNAINMLLSGQHTDFPGYWNTPAQPVCAQMSYSNPTIVPATGPNDTCPNANKYSAGCGAANSDGSNGNWKSTIDITTMASYQNNATYTNAPADGQPFCARDLNWKPFSLSASPLRQEHNRPRVK